jgi:hypothetical protein
VEEAEQGILQPLRQYLNGKKRKGKGRKTNSTSDLTR